MLPVPRVHSARVPLLLLDLLPLPHAQAARVLLLLLDLLPLPHVHAAWVLLLLPLLMMSHRSCHHHVHLQLTVEAALAPEYGEISAA